MQALRWLPLLVLTCAAASSPAQNRALKLDGDGSCVELPPNLCSNLTQATIEVWAKWDKVQNYARVLEFGRPWRSVSLINHGTSNDLRFNVYPRYTKTDTNFQYIIHARQLIRTNEWIHLAAVSGPGGMRLYANGRLVGEHTNTTSFAQVLAGKGDTTNYFGHGMSGVRYDQDFAGELDEVRIWNYERNAAEIREGMFKRLSGREPGLVHLWGFDDGTANDSTARAAHGTLRGHAVVVPSELGLVAEPVPAPALVVAPPAVSDKAEKSNAVALWIAGALTVLAIVLAWLAFMFRRSGLGSAKIVGAQSVASQLPVKAALPDQGTPVVHDELKERALAELTSFAKESLVQGLFSQRAALLEAQKQAQQELVQLETRFAGLDLSGRIRAYEARIAELERHLASRGDEVQELTHATLRLLRQKLAEERSHLPSGSRFN